MVEGGNAAATRPPREELPTLEVLQERGRRLARAYWTLAQCNRALVRATSEPDLLSQICRLLVQVGEYQMAWVGFAEDDPERTVRCVARAGFSDGYLESIRISWGDDVYGRGPTGTCIRTGKTVVNRNSLTEPGFEPWRAQAVERGFRSSISLPLVLGKRAIGALMVYSSRIDAFDSDEQELLLRLSEDLTFGIGALRDREERARAETKVQERESMYRQIVRNFPNGALGLFDLDLRYELIDGEGLADIGQSQASLEGRTNREAFPPEFADAMDPLFRSALEGRRVRVEVPFAGHWFDLHLRPVHDADGKVVAGFVSSVDITQQKSAQEATAASEELFRSAFEDASVGKALTTIEGRYVRVNRALCETFGYTPEELVGKQFADLTHPDDRVASDEANRRMLAGEQSMSQLEKRYVRRDGRIVWADVGVSLVRAPDGSPRYFITDVQDVTMRRLAEEQLRQSQKMEAVGLLAGGIAHDFNNLLTVMLSSSAFALEEAPAEGPLREDIEDFRAAAEKARGVTRQLLAFSRQQVLDPCALDLNHVVRDAERILRRLLGEHVMLRTDLAKDLGPIVADPGQIQQVIMNLAINARDAMPKGGTLTLETANIDRPPECDPDHCRLRLGSCVRLSVEDTGTGMDEATRARIFEPFFTTKPLGKGTGLGLSTVFGIVKQSGGSIHVRSEPGRGSRFDLCFPRVSLEELDAPTPPEQAGVPVAAPSETVLVVEDDDQVRRITVRMLDQAGFDVLSAATLEEALEKLQAHPRSPSVLLTDVRMPARNGPEVAAALASRIPALRTIYMSGYSSEDIGDEGGPPIGTPIVQKPFTAEALVAKIRETIHPKVRRGPSLPT